MERDDLAIDGLLRELARAPGSDDAFVSRVLARTRKPASPRPAALAAAAFLLAAGVSMLFPSPAPTGRLGFSTPACLVPEAARMRVLVKDPSDGALLVLGEAPVTADVRVPAATPLLLQALDRDGVAVWTSPRWIQIRRSPTAPDEVPLDRKSARRVEYARDVKPILDSHCRGCHAEADLSRDAVKPFEARRSPLVLQSHAPLSDPERRQLALWVDLGAPGRP